jgi:putative ABC transport system ATP-binding protein
MITIPTRHTEGARLDFSFSAGLPVISARHLDFHHTNGTALKQILFDVDLDVWPGEIVFLTGPSGSGKSTLLSLIGGVRSVRHGQLTVLGQELHQAAPRVIVPLRRRIGFIFQTHNLLDFLTVRRNVEIVFDAHPDVSRTEARRRTEDILQAVGLERHLNEHPSKLSVGQRQRVAIARALVSRPQLVLADEPTAALDSQSGREVVQLLESLAREHQSAILMVTHDNRVLDLADRIVSMEDGRLRSS